MAAANGAESGDSDGRELCRAAHMRRCYKVKQIQLKSANAMKKDFPISQI